MDKAQKWIDKLNLIPHPEGGFFREIYSSKLSIDGNLLSGEFNGRRNLSTSIYFLLRSSDVSRFHMLRSDEIWYYHTGSSLTIYSIDADGKQGEIVLGKDIEKNEVLQAVMPAGTIFGAALNEPDSFSIVGCMVSPGFTFEDFELLDRQLLLKKYPQHKDVILKITSPQ
jgi:hypothetical protein